MISKRFMIAAIFCCCNFLCYAQNRNNIWVFGDSAGINFNIGTVPIVTSIDSRGSSASISDSLGNLLFYVCDSPDALNGGIDKPSKIYNKDFQLMMYGDSIIGDAWYKEYVG